MGTKSLSKTGQFQPRERIAPRLTAAFNTGSQVKKGSAEYQTIVDLIGGVGGLEAIIDGVLSSLVNLIGPDGIVEPNTLVGRGDFGAGPLQLIFLGDGLEFNGNVLQTTTSDAWDFQIVKSALQDVVESATLTDDTELRFSVAAKDCWYVELILLYAGNSTAGDYKLNFILPNINGWYSYVGDNSAADAIIVSTGIRLSGASAFAADIVLGTDAELTPRMFKLQMMFRAGDEDELIFQFALDSSAFNRVARTYDGSILRGKRLSALPFGVSGPSEPGGGGGPGGGGAGKGWTEEPVVAFPNDVGVVIAYDIANPGQIVSDPVGFLNGVVPILQGVNARYGFNYKRGVDSGQGFNNDVISFYMGSGSVPPADGDPNVYTIDIIGSVGTPSASVTWTNTTNGLAAGGYFIGPI